MVRRNRRHRDLFSTDAERLAEELTNLHGLMMGMQRKITPGSTHYLAIERLSDCIIATIRVTTGREPDWMVLTLSSGSTSMGGNEASGRPEELLRSATESEAP